MFKEIPKHIDPRPSKILAASFFSTPYLLYWEGGNVQAEIEVVGEQFLLDHLDPEIPNENGLWVWSGKYIDDGEGDYPGTREVILSGTWRTATNEEWDRFVQGIFVWKVWHPESFTYTCDFGTVSYKK